MIETLREIVLCAGVGALLVLACLGATSILYIVDYSNKERKKKKDEVLNEKVSKELIRVITAIASSSPEIAYGLTLAHRRLMYPASGPIDSSENLEIIKETAVRFRSKVANSKV